LSYGMLARLKEIAQQRFIPDSCLPDVLQSLDDFLHYECGDQTGSMAEDPPCRDAAAWRRALTPSDFLGRLKAIVGKDPWHHSMREDLSGIPSEILPLAEELHRDPEKLGAALPYLNSPEASSAVLFGDALARLDTGGRCLDPILGAAMASGSHALARGYVGRLITTCPASAPRLNAWLNRLENDAPEIAYFVSLAAPEFTRPLERTLRLIRASKLPVQFLQNFVVGDLLDRMTPTELSTVLDLLVQASDPASLNIAVDFVGYSVQRGRRADRLQREAMWRVLEASAPVDDRGDYWWRRALEAFAEEDPDRACQTAIVALTGEDYHKREQAWTILSSLARTQPQVVMERVGGALLDNKNGWRLRTGARSDL